ncbi:Spore germination protein [Fictibacillus macauensis ZFHKF-1]|uniref:Spore germination protein n=1 Tax=Fictibacillus macauensis ZFHKF-1 TaxID=1196324 RepID=I8UK84_9BACL|nr:Spore germination protein [Fictibacillus macauensis ZFHKF-1]
MNFKVVNRQLSIGDVNIMGVSLSSVLLIGDAHTIDSSAFFDTPSTSLVIGDDLQLTQGTLYPSPAGTIATGQNPSTAAPFSGAASGRYKQK